MDGLPKTLEPQRPLPSPLPPAPSTKAAPAQRRARQRARLPCVIEHGTVRGPRPTCDGTVRQPDVAQGWHGRGGVRIATRQPTLPSPLSRVGRAIARGARRHRRDHAARGRTWPQPSVHRARRQQGRLRPGWNRSGRCSALGGKTGHRHWLEACGQSAAGDSGVADTRVGPVLSRGLSPTHSLLPTPGITTKRA